ncbi:hypothetical protein [Arenimonas malthae]|uniref:hypothetical protein n=1 Tax=Arenimonas malthae TaxID=354197 RepID=UPI0005C24280|nr:hypothetical protein [Arenimonas malthae]
MAERRVLDASWYRRNIERAGDLDFMAGPVSPLEYREEELPITIAFGTLVRLERRSKGLTVGQLARKLAIDEDEVRLIEHDSSYRARPRTIVCIAKEFDLPSKEVMKLAGAARSKDHALEEAAYKFAAYSDDLGALTSEEQKMLMSFVAFLKDKARI